MKPGYLIRRIIYLLLTFYLIITASFFLVRFAPGSPFTSEKAQSDAALAGQMARYGYDRPLMIQYGSYLLNILKGDLGPSFSYPGRGVTEIITDGLPYSISLGLMALLFAYGTGMTGAFICIRKRDSWLDYSILAAALLGLCLPGFLIAKVALYFFGFKLRIIPTAADEISCMSLFLPAIVLALPYTAYVIRLGRKTFADEMRRDYVRTARAAGIAPSRILFKQVFKNGCLPLLTFMGPAAAGLLTGSVVIEKVFSLPGIGKYFVYGAINRDHFLVLGVVILYSVLLLTFNFCIDILYSFLDPRIKAEGGGDAA